MIYFKYFINIATIVVAVMSILHIEFPYRRPLLYGLIGYIVLDELFKIFQKRRKKEVVK